MKRDLAATIERRALPTELRVQRAEGRGPRLVGHAAVFNKLSEDLGGFREKIAPGAFARALREGADVRALFNHDENFVLGRTKSNTLSLHEDRIGLHIETDPPDTALVRDLVIAPIERGDIDQMSFAFRVREDTWNVQDGANVRTLVDVDLFDVSPVTFPAYPQTDVSARSLADALYATAGIDAAALAAALVRAQRGLAPLAGDRDVLRGAVDTLTHLLRASEPTPDLSWVRARRQQLIDATL